MGQKNVLGLGMLHFVARLATRLTVPRNVGQGVVSAVYTDRCVSAEHARLLYDALKIFER
jgi:hypothetical protein